jgi:hypothetical protein
MDGLLEAIAGSVILNASERVLYMACMPIKSFIEDKSLIKEMNITTPVEGSIGILIKVNTKNTVGTVTALINEAVNQLVGAKMIDPVMIRQLHGAKLSSFEETIEVFLFSLEDSTNELQ